MKKYKTFPHTRDAVELLWAGTGAPQEEVATMLAAFDEEDRIEQLELSALRTAQDVIQIAMQSDGSDASLPGAVRKINK